MRSISTNNLLNNMRIAAALICLLMLAACSREPVNSPYVRGQENANVLYTAFTQRSPKYLDPATSYSTDETPFTYSIYEPLYGYHYLKRPYELIPKAAAEIATPVYLDAQGNELAQDVAGEEVAISILDIPIKEGILYQPHPAFAQDEQGDYRYWPIDPKKLSHMYGMDDFSHTGTRELTAHDYVYAFKRLASPRVISPIFELLAGHIEGMREFGEALREEDA